MSKKKVKIILIIEILLILIVSVLFGSFVYKTEQEKLGKITYATKLDFEKQVIKSRRPVLLNIYTDWCGDCTKVKPIVEEIAEEYKKIKVVKVNADTEKDLIKEYEITAVPTFIIIKGGKEISRVVECTNKDEIITLIKNNI